MILGAQSYGGEAIYRVYLFSAPWCALLIAGMLVEVRWPKRRALGSPRRHALRWSAIGVVCIAALFAGLQGLYGPTAVNAFTSSELNASQWLYGHASRGSVIVLPDENFPTLQAANYNSYDLQVMPSDPQLGESWLNEGNAPAVKSWISSLGAQTKYLVVSRSMSTYARYSVLLVTTGNSSARFRPSLAARSSTRIPTRRSTVCRPTDRRGRARRPLSVD